MAADLPPEAQPYLSASEISMMRDSSTEGGDMANESSVLPPVSDCLGCSVADDGTPHARRARELGTTVPSILLAKLALTFPRGKTFHFDRHGGIGSSGDDATAEPGKGSRIGDQIAGHFEEARSFMFVPLYDYVGKHAYAGFVGWTNNPKRSLQERELLYVSGFAHSIMSEVMRHQSITLDQVKSGFITSISHELRSPLHGILAANQLLSESTLARDQTELVMTVENCAQTLLDVLNQLFDHAKITGYGRSARPHRKMRGKGELARGPRAEQLPLAKIYLPALLEDTIASLVTHDSRLTSPIFEVDLSLANGDRRASLFDRQSFISVDIDPTANQPFWSHSGLWRTIILNLVGNAMKFTDAGHVHVTLKVLKPSGKNADIGIGELRIHDTGRGISDHFLRHRCFEPYTQEDNLSGGTGLGLSIVHRAAMSLRGTVAVDSIVGTGTDVVVRIPLQTVQQVDRDESVDGDLMESQLAAFRGTRFHLAQIVDQDADQSVKSKPPRDRAVAWLRLQNALASMLTKWFGMEGTPLKQADLVIVEHQAFQEQQELYDVAGLNVIVVAPIRASDMEGVRSANVVVVRSPLTPRHVLAALKSLDQQRSDGVVHNDNVVSEPARRGSDAEEQCSPDRLPSSKPEGSPPTSRPSSPQHQRPLRPRLVRNMSSVSEKRLVLLVDDNDINLRLLVIMMKKMKKKKHEFEVTTASDGRQAVESFVDAVDRGRRVHFIFMDISMPVMDGMEATRRIRDHERTRGLHQPSSRATVVAVTGLTSARDRRNILDSGVDSYVQKPVNLDILRRVLSGGGADEL